MADSAEEIIRSETEHMVIVMKGEYTENQRHELFMLWKEFCNNLVSS
jgi:hypothetical protein